MLLVFPGDRTIDLRSIRPIIGHRYQLPKSWLLSTAFIVATATQSVSASDSQRISIDLPLPTTALSGAQLTTTPQLADPKIARFLPVSALPIPATVETPPEKFQSAIQNALTNVPESKPLHLSLVRGQSLYRLFKRHHLSQADLSQMLSSSRKAKRLLSRVRPGQKITLWVTDNNRVERLILETKAPGETSLNRINSKYVLKENQIHSEQSPTLASGSAQNIQAPLPQQDPVAIPSLERTSNSPSSIVAMPNQESKELDSRVLQTKVKSGDSLYLIFKRHNIPGADLAQLMSSKDAKKLKRLHPDQRLDFVLGTDNRLLGLNMQLDETRTLEAKRSNNGFQLNIKTEPLQRRISAAGATIENSLFLAGQRAGMSDQLIMQLVEVFGWDIDFALDIRAGDRFTLIYEELFKDGKKIRDGRILAADFFNRGRSLRALRYKDASGRSAYYSPEGLSMRKAFLRTPVSFARISSRFNLRRKHPVLNRIRAHKGVDYAAPRGTAIKASGDGLVIYSGRKGGYGKAVVLKHGGKYSSLYGHMSRIHKRARRGKRVYQGQIIGYVGSTGLATGPHLHYEFRVRGVHKDPLSVKLPKALPIDKQYKADFIARSKPLVAHLDTLATTSLAGTE